MAKPKPTKGNLLKVFEGTRVIEIEDLGFGVCRECGVRPAKGLFSGRKERPSGKVKAGRRRRERIKVRLVKRITLALSFVFLFGAPGFAWVNVVLGDTGLPIVRSIVHLADGSGNVYLPNQGRFQPKKPGVFPVVVESPMGMVPLELRVDENLDGELKVPFYGALQDFSMMAQTTEDGRLVRWPNTQRWIYFWFADDRVKEAGRIAMKELNQELEGFLTLAEGGQVWVETVPAGSLGMQGREVFGGWCDFRWDDNGRLRSARIYIDERYAGNVAVIKHEMVHALGFGHSPGKGLLMSKVIDPNMVRRSLSPEELMFLKAVYSVDIGAQVR